MRVEGQQPSGRTHQSETKNPQQPDRGHFQNWDVEFTPTLGSLLNQLAEFLEDVALEFKPITEYLCQVLTLKNLMRTASDLRHKSEKASIDVKLEYTDSRSERIKLKARKELNELEHRVKKGWSDFKDDVKAGWNKRVK
ncbi:hypothetical protein [Endozoicomonas sp. 4G]|uniref:hypothetical protein n=1 Tax=Endozoicomonas sp. 4G TaxID=2872754 RepID=UPI002078E453|nr:hypothetical protein [Endozoicomonas sp. 4G]